MKLLYSRILKNHEIQIGNPMEVKALFVQEESVIREAMEEQACAVMLDDPEAFINEAREEAERQAELIISEARMEASQLMEEAEAEINERIALAEEEARSSGYQIGLEEARMQYEALLQEAAEIRQQAQAEYQEFARNIEANAVKMILDIAKKVVSEEIHLNKEHLLVLVRQAFERCTSRESIVLKVSSEDYDFMIENKEKLLAMLGGMENLDIRKDFSLSCGACIVETPFGTIDAGIQTKLRKIEEAFEQLAGSSRES